MKKLTALLFLIVPCHLYADPFDKTTRQETAISNQKRELVVSSSCEDALSPFFADNPMHELKLVGVLQQNEEWQALFINPDKQLHSMFVNQWFSKDKMQIINIEPKGVTLSYWKNKQYCTDKAILFIKL